MLQSEAALPAKSLIECVVANTPEERERVYRLRYECYRRNDSIEPSPHHLFSDRFDAQENSFSFLARSVAGETLATVRVSVVRADLGWTDSPVRHLFGDHEIIHGSNPTAFVEVSRLCFAGQGRRASFVQLLTKIATVAELFGAEWVVACPRVEHADIYQRLYGFQRLSAPRCYFGVGFETLLLGVKRTVLADYVRDIKPMRNAWSRSLADLAKLVQPDARGTH